MDKLSNGQVLTNPLDDTLLHEHVCKNCRTMFYCADPLCGGSWLDPELCADCEAVVGEFW